MNFLAVITIKQDNSIDDQGKYDYTNFDSYSKNIVKTYSAIGGSVNVKNAVTNYLDYLYTW